ncbi:MAG: acetyl-CoA carboxylase biotin carboxyl carrier protein subunit [Bacteroidales bacterium 43_8]|nr:MAG: acetyl-CoA carboxylase biotin carboxyl carrier protein subunit [Bacteroidales bacterium 43_8]
MKDFKYKINGNLYKVSINSVDESVAEVEVNGTPYKVQLDKPAKKQIKPLTRPQAAPVTPTGERTPLPGVILEISVKVGDTVKRGQKVAILEAMKMENVINADRDGKVTEIKVNKGDSVLEGADILIIG